MEQSKVVLSRFSPILGYLIIFIVSLYGFGGILTKHPLVLHETCSLYFRICEYFLEIKDYGFPPTLFPNIIQTGGFAFPSFYPPLSYYFTVLIYAMIDNVVLAVHLSLFLSVLFSGWAMFFCFRKIYNSQVALIASVLYIVFPYRFINVLVRGALAESWTFVWYPIIFLALVYLIRRNYKFGIPVLAFSLCGLILTHSVVGIYFILTIGILFGIVMLCTRSFHVILPAIWAGILSVGLSLWFVLPQQTIWNNVIATDAEVMSATKSHVERSALDLSQLFYTSAESWNIHNVKQTTNDIGNNFMSFELGFSYFVIFCAVILGCIFHIPKIKNRFHFVNYVTAGIIGLLLIIFVVYPKPFLFVMPEKLAFIQFPWRMLGVSLFFGCLVFGSTIIPLKLKQRQIDILMSIAILALVSSINPLYKNVFYWNDPPRKFDRESYIPFGNKGLVERAEYVPPGWNQDKNLGILSNRIITVDNNAIYKPIDQIVETRKFSVENTTTTTALIPLTYYPMWSIANQDGIEMKQSSNEGLISIEIPPGNNTITIKRIAPPNQKLGIILSLNTLALTVLILIFAKKTGSISRILTDFNQNPEL